MSDTPNLVTGAEAPADSAAATADPTAQVDATKADPKADSANNAQADTAKVEADATKAAEDAKAKPIEYADFAMPEGAEVDADALGQFKGVAAEAGLSQEAAQKMIDLYAAKLGETGKIWRDTQTAWRDEVNADKEYGPDLPAALGRTKQFVQQVMGADAAKTMDALNYTGAGNNPHIIKLLFRASAMAAEGQFIRGNAAEAPKTRAQVMYPDHA